MIQIDMPMPENCLECLLTQLRWSNLFCGVLNKSVGESYRYPTHTETWMKDGLDEKRLPNCPLREVIRCGKCRHYLGNHDVPGCAPCDFWGIGAVMWDDYCKRGERWDG